MQAKANFEVTPVEASDRHTSPWALRLAPVITNTGFIGQTAGGYLSRLLQPLESRLGNFQAHFYVFQAYVKQTLKDLLQQISVKIPFLESMVQRIQTCITSVEDRTTWIEGRTTHLERRASQVRNTVAHVQHSMDRNQQRTESLEKKQKISREDQQRLENMFAELTQKISIIKEDLDKGLAVVNARLANFNTRLMNLEEKVEKLSRIERLHVATP